MYFSHDILSEDGINVTENELKIFFSLKLFLIIRGGVGIGDKMNNIDRELTMKSCRKDGKIIRPDKSIRAAPVQVTFSRDSGTRPINPLSQWFSTGVP